MYCINYIFNLSFIFKTNKSKSVKDILKDEQELLEKYNKIKKNRIMVFIIGIVIGLVIIIVGDNETISLSKPIIQMKSVVEDVSDISVI